MTFRNALAAPLRTEKTKTDKIDRPKKLKKSQREKYKKNEVFNYRLHLYSRFPFLNANVTNMLPATAEKTGVRGSERESSTQMFSHRPIK